MKNSLLRISLFFICLVLNANLFAQGKLEYSGFYDTYYYRGPINIYLSAGLAKYNGEVNSFIGSDFSPNFGLGISYKLWPRTFITGEFNFIMLGAKDSDSKRGLSFSGSGPELQAKIRYNLVEPKCTSKVALKKNPVFVTPYVELGLGALYWTAATKTATTSNPTDSAKYSYQAGSSIVPIIPVSFGLAFWLNEQFTVLTDINYRYAFTPFLDGVSAGSGSDMYASLNVKLQYTPQASKKRKAKTYDGFVEPGIKVDRPAPAPKPAPVEEAQDSSNVIPTESTPALEEKKEDWGFEDNKKDTKVAPVETKPVPTEKPAVPVKTAPKKKEAESWDNGKDSNSGWGDEKKPEKIGTPVDTKKKKVEEAW